MSHAPCKVLGVGIFQTIRAVANLSDGLAAPVAVPGNLEPDTIIARSSRARDVAIDVALSIPSMRKALHVVTTPSTFDLIGWDEHGRFLAPTDHRVAWLRQPDTTMPLFWTLRRTLTDLVWHDRSVWLIRDERIDGTPVKADRVHPNRVDTITDPLDPDRVVSWIIDGREVPRSKLIVHDGAGVGGLKRYGWDLLTLYGQLQAAAGRYATAPHPHAILKNHGADLDDDEIDELLDAWEAARTTRSVGYLNDQVDYDTVGWNAEELQLTDAREHAALEVARLTGLPAKALDAKSGDSMTYANAVEGRRDILEALKPWMSPITSELSRATACRIAFDGDAYTRDDPSERMTTWGLAIDKNILTVDEVRALEPLAARNHA